MQINATKTIKICEIETVVSDKMKKNYKHVGTYI
jgi:hypothetical protein